MNTECKQCKWRDECVNQGQFKDGGCLQYKKVREKKNETIQAPTHGIK